MSLTPWLPIVRKISDGETVEQSTVNVPIDQLTQRDQHLYEKFEDMAGKSALIGFGQPMHPSSNIQPNELSVVYYLSDNRGNGLAKGIAGFSSSSNSSAFSPNTSNYSIGILKTVYQESRTADVYIEGLCEFPIDIDDAVNGLLQKNASGVVETFRVGPYFLSPKVNGKITSDPAGIPVYVGYALSKRQFLLHTNIDEFSQFFINYRYHLLDRVAGNATLTNQTWTITSSDLTKLGWVAAASAGVPKPDTAVFYYNIPGVSTLLNSSYSTYDTALTATERTEAAELSKYLPPVPANFIQLYVDGILARYNDVYDSSGEYSVNEYGLWWHTSADGSQPWHSNYPSATAPSNWGAIKTSLGADRKRLFISFSKFNPALRTQLVSSIAPYSSLNNSPGNFIKFYSKDDPTQTAPTGDLLYDVIANVNTTGVSDNTDFIYPTTIDNTFTANTAIAALKYFKPDGEFKAALTPVVAKVIEGTGISLTEYPAGSGIWRISASQGLSGAVDSIEPINSRLEFKNLTSYIKLPVPSTTPYGMIGKIVLPKGYVSNKDLRLVFHMFGDTGFLSSAINKNVAFQFQYSAVSALNGASPTTHTLVDTNSYTPNVNPAEFSLLLSGDYTAFTSVKVTHPSLTIPAAFVSEDSIINFKILRVSTGVNNQSYLGNVGILATYWEVVT